MRRKLFLGAWLLVAPMGSSFAGGLAADTAEPVAATAATDDMAQMNAVSKAWDRYVEACLKDDPATADLIAPSSLRHYEFLRDVARAGSADQLRRLLLPDRGIVYALRATQKPEALAALDGAGVARLAFGRNWSGAVAPQERQSPPQLTHVTVLPDDVAVGELRPPNGTQFNFGPSFVRVDGRWKVVTESTTPDEAMYLGQFLKQSGQSEAQLMQAVIARFVGTDSAPNLAMLDAAPVDDAALRTRINETWPDYNDAYRTRVRAMERKAIDGDPLAQFAYGTMLYTGEAPTLVRQDKPRGLALLEQASNGGDARAASVLAASLMTDDVPKDGPFPPDRLKRALPHLRRAAESGAPIAMGALGNFHFNGAGGLARDCLQAEEWEARAEDAGWEPARNERVWYLAVCPIPEQRNPARALELAAAMIAAADKQDYAGLDTIAAVYAANGRFTEAVDFQKRAIAALQGDESGVTRRGMKERLKAYQGKLDWTQTYSVYERR